MSGEVTNITYTDNVIIDISIEADKSNELDDYLEELEKRNILRFINE